jgi:polyhydroxybutyrate depolymerase
VIGILGEPVRRVGVVAVVGLAVFAGACSSGSGSRSGSGGSSSTSRAARVTTAAADVPAAPSAGCKAATAPTAGSTKQTVTAGGTERWFWLDVPPAVATGEPMPLVLDLHGYSEGANVHVAMSGLGKFGETKGFVTVTPQGSGVVPMWDTGLHSADMNFLGDALDTVERQVCIDTNRVYATGLSNGAFMTSAVACRYSDRVAAVAPVAGARVITGCKLTRPVPIVAFHGTADQFVAYDGGVGQAALNLPAPDGSGRRLGDTMSPKEMARWRSAGKSIPVTMQAWAKRNGCPAGHTEQPVAADVTRFVYACPPVKGVELYRVSDGGHTWPGSPVSVAAASLVGHTTMNISADEIMWKFFQDHPLRPGS